MLKDEYEASPSLVQALGVFHDDESSDPAFK